MATLFPKFKKTRDGMNVICEQRLLQQVNNLVLNSEVCTGCGICVDSHEKMLRENGLTTEQIQSAARIAAVVHAVSVVLEAEKALKTPLVAAA